MSDDGRRPLSWHPLRSLLVGLLCAALLLAAGAYIGGRSPWGTKHPEVARGVAMRANSDNDLMMFDGDDGTQLQFGGHHIWWESESSQGEGNPPCLRTPHRKVEVQVAAMKIARPDGGSFQQAVWVTCP